MRNTIKKILKENEFEWASEPLDIPLDEIEQWCDSNRTQLSKYIQSLETTLSKLPKLMWAEMSDEEMRSEQTQRILGITSIHSDLRNIYDSLDQADKEIQEFKNDHEY